MLFRNKYRIESARLPGWDYSSPGYYFLTVCTHDRVNLFGEIIDGKMVRNNFGQIVFDEWMKSFEIRRELMCDEFTVMPNHFHGIVRLVDFGGQNEINGNAVAVAVVVETSGRTSLRRPQQRWRRCENRLESDCRPRLRPKSVSSFMAGVKSVITKRINTVRGTPGTHILQYRFHDHIVRNEQELYRIRQYIRNNPANWGKDKMNSTNNSAVCEYSPEYEKEDWMIYV